MTIDPFTTPAEAEREACVKQARDFFALAMTPEHLVTSAYVDQYRYNYANGVEAVRDALVGQGHATLAVNANLDRIATVLETLAAAPSAIARVAESLTELGVDVREMHTAIEGCYEATTSGSIDVAAAVREVGEILEDRLSVIATTRPRWWQWRLRRQVRAAAGELAAEVTA